MQRQPRHLTSNSCLCIPCKMKWKKGLPPCGDNPFRVGLARFELAASSSRTKRATKLRHSPMLLLRNRKLLYDVWSTMAIRRRVACGRLRGDFRGSHCFSILSRSVSWKVPYAVPRKVMNVAGLTEASVRYATKGARDGLFHGRIRMPCRGGREKWRISRKLPQAMPCGEGCVANSSEASEFHAMACARSLREAGRGSVASLY